jgi:hypothetical protein
VHADEVTEIRIVLLAESFVRRVALNLQNAARRRLRLGLAALLVALPLWFLWGLVEPERGPWLALLDALLTSLGFVALVATLSATARALFPGERLAAVLFCEQRIVLERHGGGASRTDWSWVKAAHEDDEGLWIDVLSLRASQTMPSSRRAFPCLFVARKRITTTSR